MRHVRRLVPALAACLLAGPAFADSAAYSPTTNWQKIASSGATVLLQSPTGAVIRPSAGTPADQAGEQLLPNQGLGPYTLGADLYARAGTVVVTTGLGAIQPGSTGTDYSANPPAIPNVGAAFGATGPYANYVLVKTIPAGTRNAIDVENASGSPVVVVRDDGTAASGSAPANASVFPLAGGSSVGQQGGSWSSSTFKGRVQVYAPASTAQVTVMVD